MRNREPVLPQLRRSTYRSYPDVNRINAVRIQEPPRRLMSELHIHVLAGVNMAESVVGVLNKVRKHRRPVRGRVLPFHRRENPIAFRNHNVKRRVERRRKAGIELYEGLRNEDMRVIRRKQVLRIRTEGREYRMRRGSIRHHVEILVHVLVTVSGISHIRRLSASRVRRAVVKIVPFR